MTKKKKIPSPPPALVEALTPGPSLSVCPCSRAECRAVSKSTVDSLTDTLVRCIVGNRRQINTVEDNDFSKVLKETLNTFSEPPSTDGND